MTQAVDLSLALLLRELRATFFLAVLGLNLSQITCMLCPLT